MQNTTAPALPTAAVAHALRWRYAVKKFDSTRKIDAPTWQVLEDSLVLAPSSYGLQPWRFYVVDNPATREELVAFSWGQRQVAEASHLVVLAGRVGLEAGDIERWVQRMYAVRKLQPGALDAYKGMMLGTLKQSTEQLSQWNARQLYLAMGQLLTTAAVLGIDACPMEGIDPAKYDERLKIGAEGYHAWAAVTLGYRSADDKSASAPKVRFAPEEVVRHLA